MSNKLRKGIVLIVRNHKGKYLLLKHCSNKLWSMISGGVESNEKIIEAVVRESKEESGLIIHPNGLVDLNKVIKFENKHGQNLQSGFFYETESPKIEVDNKEICDFGWFGQDKLLQLLKAKPPLIELFRYFINSVAF